MKKIYLSIAVVLICFPSFLSAQDWQCVREGVTATFVDTTSIPTFYTKHTMWVVNIDSVRIHEGWNYYYGFPQIRLISETNNYATGYEYCYDAFGPSRMGPAMSALDGENFFFNSAGDPIRISTYRSPGQPWICCRINDTTHLYATVESVNYEPVLGISDSVKYISFQAKNNITGESVAHPMNNQVFVLSKSFGMITLYDFYIFPVYSSGPSFNSPVHLLAGYHSQDGTLGEQVLMKKEIFSYAVGDIFHTLRTDDKGPHFGGSETRTVHRVLDLIWNPTGDEVTYSISRLSDKWSGYFTDAHHYSLDTAKLTYSIYSGNCVGLNTYPEQTLFCFDTAGILKSANSFVQYAGPNSRRVKTIQNNYKPYSFCSDTLVGNFISYWEYKTVINSYIDGCGGPFYNESYTDFYHDYYESFYKLVYFNKGTETWGTPWDTSDWVLPYSIPDSEQVKFILYPNPAGDLVNIEIPETEISGYRLEIFSITGLKINEISITESKSAFDVSNFRSGMYFLKLYKDNIQVGQQKLVKQ